MKSSWPEPLPKISISVSRHQNTDFEKTENFSALFCKNKRNWKIRERKNYSLLGKQASLTLFNQLPCYLSYYRFLIDAVSLKVCKYCLFLTLSLIYYWNSQTFNGILVEFSLNVIMLNVTVKRPPPKYCCLPDQR